MFKHGLLRAILALLLGLTACSRLLPTASSPQALPSPAASWTTIKLMQSGGIAAVILSVEVSSDGQLKAEDRLSGRSVVQSVTPEAMAELTRLFSKSSALTAAAPHSNCADCFIYDLEVTSAREINDDPRRRYHTCGFRALRN